MPLNRLQVAHFRNLSNVAVDFSPGLNLVYGANGSGKTSLLECCYFLSSARSFRGTSLDPIIQRGHDECRVVGWLQHRTQQHQVGIERNREGQRLIRLDGETVHRATELARLLPAQVLAPDSVDLLLGPPDLRRRFLNWGLFHVEHGFAQVWEEANRCLKQRNQLLRQGHATSDELASWSAQLVKQATQLDTWREEYILSYQQEFARVVQQLTDFTGVEINYFRGWDRDRNLLDIYREDIEKDKKNGFTQKGFQRADVRITVGGQPATKVCSRGELKVLVWSMLLAQGALADKHRDTIYLVDDLASEFDAEHRRRVCGFLAEAGNQVIVTGVDRDSLVSAAVGGFERMFHVKHGQIESQIQG